MTTAPRLITIAPFEPHHPIELGESGLARLAADVSVQPTPEWAREALEVSALRSFVPELTESMSLVASHEGAATINDPQRILERTAAIGWLQGHALAGDYYLTFALEEHGATAFSVQSAERLSLDAENMLDQATLAMLGELVAADRATPSSSPVGRAIALMHAALLHRDIAVRSVLMWSALEALFGPANRKKTTFRMACRIAVMLGGDDAHVRANYQEARESYELRCEVVHGTEPSACTAEPNWLTRTLRDLLGRILRSPELRASFRDEERDAFLRRIVDERGVTFP